MATWGSYIYKALQNILDSRTDTIPPYEEESVHRTQELVKLIRQTIEDTDESLALRKLILEQYANRLQEGISLYNRARLNKIVDIKFQTKGTTGQDIRKNLTPKEIEFLDNYNKGLAQYKKAAEFDPTESFRPPQGLNAEVMVLRDTGSIMVGDNFISLKQNEILTLRSNYAQELQQMGFVKITEYLK